MKIKILSISILALNISLSLAENGIASHTPNCPTLAELNILHNANPHFDAYPFLVDTHRWRINQGSPFYADIVAAGINHVEHQNHFQDNRMTCTYLITLNNPDLVNANPMHDHGNPVHYTIIQQPSLN